MRLIDSMLNHAANKIQDIGKVVKSMNSGDTTIPSKQSKTVMSTTLDAGVYIITAYAEWANDIPTAQAIYQISQDGNPAARYRGSMNGGGGITLTTVLMVESSAFIEYRLYNGHSSGVVAKHLNMDIVQLSDIVIGGHFVNLLHSFISGRRLQYVYS